MTDNIFEVETTALAHVEEGREEEYEKERTMRSEVTRRIIAGVPKEAYTVGGGVARNTVSVAKAQKLRIPSKNRAWSSAGSECRGIELRVMQKNGIALRLKTVLKTEMSWTGMKTMR